MITKDIARLVFNCYAEIEQCDAMIEDMKKSIDAKGNLEMIDSWNDKHDSMELRIPSGRGSHYIKRFSAEMSLRIIEEHKQNQLKELERLKGVCKIQLA